MSMTVISIVEVVTLRNSVFPASRAGLSCKFPFRTPSQRAECQWNCTRPCTRQNMQGRCLSAVSVAQGERCLERGSPYTPGRVTVATSSAALTPHVAASRGPTPPTSGYPSVRTWLCGNTSRFGPSLSSKHYSPGGHSVLLKVLWGDQRPGPLVRERESETSRAPVLLGCPGLCAG